MRETEARFWMLQHTSLTRALRFAAVAVGIGLVMAAGPVRAADDEEEDDMTFEEKIIDGIMRGAAELRPLGPAFGREAEAAFSIEAHWQSHGVGSALLDRTLLAARNRGIKRLHMACLADNRRMQELARKFAAELSFDFGGVVGEVAAARPTPLSVMRELVADGHGFATAMLDVQSRLLKPV